MRHQRCDTIDGDGDCDINCDTDGDGDCDINCDTDGDGDCDINCDTDGDGDCDINCDTDGDGDCDINCDTDGDGDCDINCDTDGDGDCDINCDTDGDGSCDTDCDDQIQIAAKVFLGGAYNETDGLMRDDLRSQNLIPTLQPYSILSDFNYLGSETIDAGILNTTGQDAIVDWIIVELRDANTPATIIETKAGLLQRDGDIVALNGTSALNFTSPNGNYYVAIRHRNHLGCMTATAQTLTTSLTAIDFTNSSTAIYQLSDTRGSAHARQTLSGGEAVLWPGNYSSLNGTSDKIIFQGANSDVDDVFIKVITNPANTQFLPVYIVNAIYDRADGNLDGKIILQGADADQDYPFISVGLHPDNTNNLPIYVIHEQIPK